MASSQLPRRAQAVITKCNLCDRGNDARWYCTDCDEEMCKQCKTTHLRSKLSQNHNVISIAADVDTDTGGQGSNKTSLCSAHPQEHAQMFCINCEILVCLQCIAGDHQKHTFDTIANAIGKYKEEIGESIIRAKEQISNLQSSLKSLHANEADYTSESDELIAKMIKKKDEWISEITTVTDVLIAKVMQYRESDLKATRDKSEEMIGCISDRTTLVGNCEEQLLSENDSVIKFAVEVKESLDNEKSFTYTLVKSPVFMDGYDVDFGEAFGQLQPQTPEEKKTVLDSKGNKSNKQVDKTSVNKSADQSSTIDTTAVASIVPRIDTKCLSAVNKDEIWSADGFGFGSNICLINTNGKVVKKAKMTLKIFDIAVTSENELLLTSDHQIMKYTKDGESECIVDASPNKTRGIHVTYDSGILVCLTGSGTKVIRLTTTGQIKQTIAKYTNGRPLFQSPLLVTENINRDVCVVDENSAVVVLNENGYLRYRYPGGVQSISCYGIVCDRFGFILISDRHDQRIHQIDKDGRFVQFVITKQEGIRCLWGLSIDVRGQLWLCNQQSANYEIKVVKYRSYTNSIEM